MNIVNRDNLVSIVIPAKNEELNIGVVLDDIICLTNKLHDFSFEIIVVNDNSDDKTYEISKDKGVTVINNHRTAGKGHALISGFEKAKGKYIIMMDADHSHRAEDIPDFLSTLEEGAGLVIGSRIFGGSDEYTRIRAFGNLFLTLIFGVLHKRYLSDALNGYKAFRKEVFKTFEYTSKDFEIEIELLANTLRMGYTIKEISSHERKRRAGNAKSKVIKHGTKFLWRIIKEKFRSPKHFIKE